MLSIDFDATDKPVTAWSIWSTRFEIHLSYSNTVTVLSNFKRCVTPFASRILGVGYIFSHVTSSRTIIYILAMFRPHLIFKKWCVQWAVLSEIFAVVVSGMVDWVGPSVNKIVLTMLLSSMLPESVILLNTACKFLWIIHHAGPENIFSFHIALFC